MSDSFNRVRRFTEIRSANYRSRPGVIETVHEYVGPDAVAHNLTEHDLEQVVAEHSAALDELAAARDLAWQCGHVLRQMPTSLSELLDIDYEDLPGWFLSYRAPSGGDER